MNPHRYIVDALYGRITLPPWLWPVLRAPELQRLREVRLCNINSLCLTGGANINRYEHSLGTAFLALRCVEEWPVPLDDDAKHLIVLAALLHDVGSAAFGHSVEYVLAEVGYHHEAFAAIVGESSTTEPFHYRLASLQPVFFGMLAQLPRLLDDSTLGMIDELVNGRGPFGPLISGTIDLDNIDNVYRLAHHIGLHIARDVPRQIAESMWVEAGQLVVKSAALPLIAEWVRVRERLYTYLLYNPDEFSAKCMLEEALRLAQERPLTFFWHDVDFQLLEKLHESGAEARPIAKRLMIGDLYGCAGIFRVAAVPSEYADWRQTDFIHTLQARLERVLRSPRLESHFKALRRCEVRIHLIGDFGKTRRSVDVMSENGDFVRFGPPSEEVIIGVFFRNSGLSMTELGGAWGDSAHAISALRSELSDALGGRSVEYCVPFSEGSLAL